MPEASVCGDFMMRVVGAVLMLSVFLMIVRFMCDTWGETLQVTLQVLLVVGSIFGLTAVFAIGIYLAFF